MMLRGDGRFSSAEATAVPAKTAIKESERTNDWLSIIFSDGLVVFEITSWLVRHIGS
jgi:hypothetical protein